MNRNASPRVEWILFIASTIGLLLACALTEVGVVTGKRVIQAHHLLFLPQGTTLFLDWHFFLFVIPVVLIIQQFRALLRGRYFDQGLWGIIGSIYFAIGYSLISAIALLLPWALP